MPRFNSLQIVLTGKKFQPGGCLKPGQNDGMGCQTPEGVLIIAGAAPNMVGDVPKPVASMGEKSLTRGTSAHVQSFLEQLAKTPAVTSRAASGRLIFALDATASREPTWTSAQALQREMFDAASSLGGLELQLCYYLGLDGFHATPWLTSSAELKAEMNAVHCLSGYTQIGRVLAHTLAETRRTKVAAVVFIGDCMEESAETLLAQAGELGLRGVRAFLFQEGDDPVAARSFRQIAKLTGGAYGRFDTGSADELRRLLGAVAAYAAGGVKALDAYSVKHGGAALQLTHQIKRT